MSRILIDTSVWIEFFNPKSRLSENFSLELSNRIISDEVAMIEPIRAELLSGAILPKKKSEIEACLSIIQSADLAWNDRKIWDEIISLSNIMRSHRLSVPGVVDRMVLLAASKTGSFLCTLDKSLLNLARIMDVATLEVS